MGLWVWRGGALFDVRGRWGWGCGYRGNNGEGVRGHIVDLRASRCSGPWPRLVNSAGERCGRGTISAPIWFTWGHIGSARTVVGMVGVVWSASFPATAGTVTLVLKASDGCFRCRHMKGCWYRWEYACSCLITFFSIALCSVVFGVW